ncbi:MAG TPA: peptide ABC transporter substrate-binding protein [Fimbriimonas sp.]|nr:peptide ABC transporter substrate-binding protein [Fimbriimonas sp.]
MRDEPGERDLRFICAKSTETIPIRDSKGSLLVDSLQFRTLPRPRFAPLSDPSRGVKVFGADGNASCSSNRGRVNAAVSHVAATASRGLLAGIVSTILLAGCQGHFSDRSAASHKDQFSFALSNKITTLDPGKVQDIEMGGLLRNVFEGLVSYDAKNQIVPQLAESWKVSNHGRTYTFTLRKGVKFHNGRELEAADFKWSWERNLAPALQSPIALDYLRPIVGAEAFATGKAKDLQGVTVVDSHTLSVTIDKPRAYFVGELTYPCAYVMAKEAAGASEITKPSQAIGTGPFKFVTVDEDQELDLDANESYYLGAPTIRRINCPIIPEASTRLTKYRNGELDELGIPWNDLAAVRKDPKLSKQIHYEVRPAVYYFFLDEHSYVPFRDARVRKAFAMAFGHEHLVNDLLSGYTLAHGILPPGLPAYREDFKGLPDDPAQAKELLSQAQFTGDNLPPLELAYRDQSPEARIAATAAASALQQNLGVKVQPRAYSFPTLLELRRKNRLQMVFSDWYADYLDPQNFLSLLFTSSSPQNSCGWSSSRFDELCAKADTDPDQQERLKLYQEAEGIAVDSAALLPIFFQRDTVLISPRVEGIQTNMLGDMPYTKVRIKS